MSESADVARTLETLKDLDGIFGSFVVAESGVIVAQDLPSYFGSAAYDVGPRALRFFEALALAQGEVSHCVLRYGDHKVALRKIRGALLTIVGRSDVNVPALRMAMNLVARKLSTQNLDGLGTGSPQPPTVRPRADSAAADATKDPPSATRSKSKGAPEAAGSPRNKKRAIYFRGKRVQ